MQRVGAALKTSHLVVYLGSAAEKLQVRVI